MALAGHRNDLEQFGGCHATARFLQVAVNRMPARKPSPSDEALEPLIFSIRGRRVMLDTDLARLYGVVTKVLNQAVRRNTVRFPEDFAFHLTFEDVERLRSQIVTSNQKSDGNQCNNGNWSQFATSSRGGRRYLT